MLCLNWTPITLKLIFFKKEFSIGFIDEKSSEKFHQKRKKKKKLFSAQREKRRYPHALPAMRPPEQRPVHFLFVFRVLLIAKSVYY